MHALPPHNSSLWCRCLLAAVAGSSLSLWMGAPADGLVVALGWGRFAIWALVAWVVLLTAALFLARGFRQPIVRITVGGRPGEPGEVRVRGWWPAPALEEIQTWIVASGLPGGTEIWARLTAGEVSIRSNLPGGDAVEEALRRFLAPPPPSVQ